MRFYRIKQISENEFIPQTKVLFDSWHGIETPHSYAWFSPKYQEKYCKRKTFEEAKQVIDDFKKHKKLKNLKSKYPKYHKI
jgi:hypothetical protein